MCVCVCVCVSDCDLIYHKIFIRAIHLKCFNLQNKVISSLMNNNFVMLEDLHLSLFHIYSNSQYKNNYKILI